ncbi:hypothetical protein [Alteribacillus persepolensis]|nr:hypothetical protein [Alteribacillus persepolensis]
MVKTWGCVLWITVMNMLAFPFISEAMPESTGDNAKHAVLIIVPGLSYDGFFELMNEPAAPSLWTSADMIMLNRVADGRVTPVSEVLTLSSGIRAQGIDGEPPLLKQGEPQEKEYTYYYPSFHEWKHANQQTTHQSQLGLLGEVLQTNNVHTSFIGHSDIYDENVSFAPFFTVNTRGETAGRRDTGVITDHGAPGGYRMDTESALKQISGIQNRYLSTWTVVEWGDIYRQRHIMANDTNRKEAISHLAQFITAVRQNDAPIFLLGVAPPVEDMKKGLKMVPFVKWEQTEREVPAFLYSDTVKQAYIGSGIDAAPTFLQTFHIETPERWRGNALYQKNIGGQVNSFYDETSGAAAIHKTRAPVLSSYITLLALLLVIGFVYGKWKKKNNSTALYIIKSAVLAGMISPLSFTLAPLFFGRQIISVPVYCAAVSIFSVGCGLLLAKWYQEKAVWIVSFGLVAILTADLLLGAPLIQRSYLGYDPLIGARYGGIGNELGGFFAAASVLAVEPWWRDKKKRMWIVVFFFLVILGSSSFGKNAGVMLASGLMFASLLLISKQNSRITIQRLLMYTLVALLSLLGMLWLFQQFGGPSHIGGAFQLLFNGEWREILGIIWRKMQMNIKIIMHSNWTKLLLTSYIISLLYLLFQSNHTFKPSQQDVLRAGAVGSVFLLLLNDSGAVAAATSMFYLLCARYVWSFKDEE